MKKKFFFFIFKYKHRKNIFNNFLKIKTINNYRLYDLSGPYKYYFFSKIISYLVQKFNIFFKNIYLISCDGKPIIIKNGVNIWFGGTSHKVPEQYKNLKNNCHVFENFIKKEENLIKLFPANLKLISPNKNLKIVFIGTFNFNKHKIVNLIWKNEKNKILKNYNLIEKKSFWKKYKLEKHKKIITYYLGLKDLIRFHSIKKLNNVFKKDLVIVGTAWKPYIKSSLNNNHDPEYIRSLYKGNICLDFGSKWGDSCLYPRSVNIIESGGILLQVKQSDSKIIYHNIYNDMSFNSFNDLTKKINRLIDYKKISNNLYFNQFKIFNNKNLNYKTLQNISKISNKNKNFNI